MTRYTKSDVFCWLSLGIHKLHIERRRKKKTSVEHMCTYFCLYAQKVEVIWIINVNFINWFMKILVFSNENSVNHFDFTAIVYLRDKFLAKSHHILLTRNILRFLWIWLTFESLQDTNFTRAMHFAFVKANHLRIIQKIQSSDHVIMLEMNANASIV